MIVENRDKKEYGPKEDMKVFKSGAVREAINIKYHLIPACALRRLAKIYTEGCKKYAPRNWEKGILYSEMYDHLLEHLQKYKEGDRTEDHLAKVAWGCFAMMFYDNKRLAKQFNDLNSVKE
jgi:hypothetical protein